MSTFVTEEGLRFYFEEEFSVLCPFCNDGRDVHLGKVDGDYALMHDGEPCQRFQDLTCDEFMAAVRMKMSN